MNSKYIIRDIQPQDYTTVLDIYSYYVQHTVITFEYDVPCIEEFEGRIKHVTTKYPWLVCEYEGKIIGYAYASDFRFRSAYQWSPEASVYLANGMGGKGIGRKLYQCLMDLLQLQGIVNVFGCMTAPNEASERLHTSLGFKEAGVFEKIGYKFGNWHDTKWFQLVLVDYPKEPQQPKAISEIRDSEEFRAILSKVNEG